MRKESENYSLMNDEELMLAYQEGDSRAFNEIYDRTADILYGYLQRRISAQELVDDIFQATLAKFHQVRSQYRPPLPVLPWLFTICRTVMIDSFRKQGRQHETFDDDMDKYQHDDSSVTDAPLVLGPAIPNSVTGLKTLSTPQKEALTLRFEHDLSFEEIAKRLETTPTNARQLVSRAVKKLKTFAQKKDGIRE